MSTLFIVTAPSGSGKTSIMRSIMDNEIVSFTTRDKRLGEVEGVDYIYISKDQFFDMKANDELVEETFYSGNYYGLTIAEVFSKLRQGSAFAIVDYFGMQQLKKIYPQCITIFIYTKRMDAIDNMLDRGDSIESIEKRLETFNEEQRNRINYDYIISNDRGYMNETASIIKKIIELKG